MEKKSFIDIVKPILRIGLLLFKKEKKNLDTYSLLQKPCWEIFYN